MSFPRYPEYKQSGVGWLGNIPEHWRIMPLRRAVRLVSERAIEGANPIALENVESWTGKFLEREGDYSGEGIAFLRGDVLFGKLRPYLAKAYFATGPGEAVGDFHVMRPNPELNGEFLLRILLTKELIDIVHGSTYGAKMPRVGWDFMGSLQIGLPDRQEQQAICSFLDGELCKIDALVDEQRRLIELLKEKRQAVISHAVTKGLNPDAPMQPSGIDWLGDVPSHWKVGALKHFVQDNNGAIKTGPFGSQLTSSEMQNGTIKVYNQRNVIEGDFALGDEYISEEKFKTLKGFETFPGDLLVTTRGTIGRTAILPSAAERGVLHPCLLRIQTNPDVLEPRYLEELIQESSLVRNQLSYMSNATTIEVIYSGTMANVVVPIPPLQEQLEILLSLDHETKRLDGLIQQANCAIDLLQERRSALISAAVTGKIDVRQAVLEPVA